MRQEDLSVGFEADDDGDVLERIFASTVLLDVSSEGVSDARTLSPMGRVSIVSELPHGRGVPRERRPRAGGARFDEAAAVCSKSTWGLVDVVQRGHRDLLAE